MFRASRWMEWLYDFFTGTGFPAFGLSLLFFYEVVLVGLMFVPTADAGLGAFAEDFRVWCLGYDPSTGRMNLGYALGMVLPPLSVAGIIAWLWWAPLRALRTHPAAFVRSALAAALLLGTASAGLLVFGPQPARGELPFPADALRTALRPPDLRLTNQAGKRVDLTALRGKVVMLTAVYASCPHTCPRILAEAKRVIGTLTPTERADLRVVAVTLDPANDSAEVLSRLAEMHGMQAPLYNLVTGDVPEVERILDRMSVSRRRDPRTGVIDHANLFVLVDRKGKVAYRLTLGPRQERWLESALQVLLREPPDAG